MWSSLGRRTGNSSRWSEAEDMPIESELDIPTNINYEEYEDDFEDDCDDPVSKRDERGVRVPKCCMWSPVYDT